MKKKDKAIEKLTFQVIKNLELDEPSSDFTKKVMQAVALEPQLHLNKEKNYWWVLVFIPVIAAISFYLTGFLKMPELTYFSNSFAAAIEASVNQFLLWLASLKNINISSVLVIGFIAAVLLLTIEECIKWIKITSASRR
jgi:hypothetical protein